MRVKGWQVSSGAHPKALAIACLSCLLLLAPRGAHAVIVYQTDAGMITPADGDTVTSPVSFSSTHGYYISGADPGQQIDLEEDGYIYRDGQTQVYFCGALVTAICNFRGERSDSLGCSGQKDLAVGGHDCHAETELQVNFTLQSGCSSTLVHFTVR